MPPHSTTRSVIMPTRGLADTPEKASLLPHFRPRRSLLAGRVWRLKEAA